MECLLVMMCVVGLVASEFDGVDVAKLAAFKEGTELFVLESTNHVKRAYRLEDFFWTGSGDGAIDMNGEETFFNSKTTTIYETKTVLSTVFVDSPSTNWNQSKDSGGKCSFNCEGSQIPEGDINPTPTYQINEFNQSDGYLNADRQFWLLTVLKSDGRDPEIVELKNSLAKLYQKAFHRQQERHLGINNRSKRAFPQKEEPVNVYIHDIVKTPEEGEEKIEVLYHVAIAGKPIPAATAASDMTLISDEEVRKELGYPFVIKAEPYLKPSDPQSQMEAKQTWIFIGTSILVLIALLLMVAFVILGCGKRKKTLQAEENRQQVFQEENSYDNKSFVHGERQYRKKGSGESPTYINFRHQISNQTIKSGILVNRPASSVSSSSISGSSIDISPLLHHQKKEPTQNLKKNFRPKAALNKTAPMSNRYDESEGSISPDESVPKTYDSRVMTPKSYLSMPSVKSFPRSSMPESLSKVLEPVSVLHLDRMDYDECANPETTTLTRHGSLSAVEDPGVIGPVVWSLHQQRLAHGLSMDEGIEDLQIKSSVSRMRKRFHDLLDDTFSLFGSRRESPVPSEPNRTEPIEVKSHSAVINVRNKEDQPTVRPRPKTSILRKPSTSPKSEPPKGAWMSGAPSPLVRPLSAGSFLRPHVNVEQILAEGKLKPNDPAVPLIAAIKSELEKCSLPGSTTELNQ